MIWQICYFGGQGCPPYGADENEDSLKTTPFGTKHNILKVTANDAKKIDNANIETYKLFLANAAKSVK